MDSFSNAIDDDGINEYDTILDEQSDSDNKSNDSSDSETNEQTEVIAKKVKKNLIDLNVAYDEMIDWIDEFKSNNDANLNDDDDTYKNLCLLPWVEKFRPKTLNDVISHETIISTLKKFIENSYFPHLLLSGPPGKRYRGCKK
jgi:hypothetical protein